MKTVWLIVALLLASPCVGMRKVFPATRDSVRHENLRADHLGLRRFVNESDMEDAIGSGVLVPVPISCHRKLPENRRYVLPDTAFFMLLLDTEFHRVTGKYLVVDSAIRPVTVQTRLARHNRSAAPATGDRASSHERGTTFDLSRKMKRSSLRWLLTRLAYYSGRGDVLVIEERACIHVFVGGTDVRL